MQTKFKRKTIRDRMRYLYQTLVAVDLQATKVPRRAERGQLSKARAKKPVVASLCRQTGINGAFTVVVSIDICQSFWNNFSRRDSCNACSKRRRYYRCRNACSDVLRQFWLDGKRRGQGRGSGLPDIPTGVLPVPRQGRSAHGIAISALRGKHP